MKRWTIPLIFFYLAAIAVQMPMFTGALDCGYEKADDLMESAKTIFPSVLVLVAGGMLLLCVRVDRHVRPARTTRSLIIPVAVAVVLFLVLSHSLFLSLCAGIWGDTMDQQGRTLWFAMATLGCWLLWGLCFLLYTSAKRSDNVVRRAVNWLFVGSVLEVLVAVPCHIAARQRHDCCAPHLTMWGICIGASIMLMCLGPGVVFLYMDRLARKRAKQAGK